MTPAKTEQIKLTANLLNALASGTMLAAVVAPYVGFGMGTAHPSADTLNLITLSALGVVLGIMLHLIARRILNGLDA